MADITIPSSPNFTNATFRLVRAVAQTESPMSFQTKRTEHSGKKWVAELELPKIYDSENQGKWRRFLVEAKGGIQTFLLSDPTYQGPNGDPGGTPQFDSFDGNNRTIKTSGWDANTTVLKEGDYLSIKDELKLVMSDATTDGSGDVTINVRPPFRQSLKTGDSIEFNDPKGEFILNETDVEWTSEDFRLNISFEVREHLQT